MTIDGVSANRAEGGVVTRDLGPYRILDKVGEGGMGEVYRACDTRLDRVVAIKILPPAVADNPSRRARFAREARSISQLSHPHICAIYDVGEVDGTSFIVMEHIDGESLERRLRVGPLPWEAAVDWGIQICGAVDAAHRRGIVHRDLKPSNIMLSDSGVKLLDFGVAKLLETSDDPPKSTESLTAEHRLVGTIHYMSPEQLEGRAVDTRTDIFALGVTMYEMVSGRKAFGGTTAASVSAAILTSEPPPISSTTDAVLPPAVDHIIRRALAKNPDERWQTARDVMLELRWIQEGRVRRTSVVPRARSRPTRVALGVGVVALAAVAGLTGWRIGRRQGEPPPSAPIVFTIAPPPGTKFSSNLAVSADGRKIAFVAGPEGGQTRLWWQSLDSTVAHPLLGTEGGNQPFWSPDGGSIGYNANGSKQLRRVGILDGKITAIAERGGTLSAYWASDGSIVFSQPDGLYRINANGGEPAKLTPMGLFPGALPEQRFQYFVWVNSSRDTGLRVEGPGLKAPVSLPSVQSNAVYAAGYLVFRQNSSLVAQAFDGRSIRFTATAPVTLAEGVAYNPANLRTQFDASPDLIAYRPEAPRRLTWRDRTGRIQGSIGEPSTDWNPTIAPDGSLRVAFDRFDRKTNSFHIWTIDDQAHAVQITQGIKERFPAWSPDGQWIAHWSLGSSDSELVLTRADGSGSSRLLLQGVGRLAPQDFSSDGKFLVYEAQDGNDLYALPLSGGKPARLTNTPTSTESRARLSADGKWIAYVSDESGVNRHEVWIQGFPDGEGGKQKVSINGGLDPSWRADGKELFYVDPDGWLLAVHVSPSGSGLAIGQPQRLFQFHSAAGVYGLVPALRSFSASPDGQHFLVLETTATPEVITVIAHWQSMLR